MKQKSFHELEKKIGTVFHNKNLLQNVFIHRSFLNENKSFPLSSNEKLEFLGDSVLSLITSMYLYRHYPKLQEGDYTEIKASIVRMESLAGAAKTLKLGSYLYLSKGQDRESGRENTNLLADCFEALIAALFIDQGFDTAYKFVNKYLLSGKLAYIIEHSLYLSPKSRLQEYSQAKYKVIPVYKTLEENGPEHHKLFNVAVYIQDKKVGNGSGKSKKEAEELAARNAFENIDKI